MATDWSTLRSDAISAAQSVLGPAWAAASSGATGAITSLVHTAQYIDQNKASMTPAEAQFLSNQQKQAMQNVLTGYEAIGIAAAQNAVAAVIQAVLTAIPALVGFL